MFTFGLTGSEIERTVPAIGKVVSGILLEGGILVTGKLIYGSVPDRLAIRCVNEGKAIRFLRRLVASASAGEDGGAVSGKLT